MRLHLTAAVLGVAGFAASTSTADTITVCAFGCDETSIIHAIEDASDGDVIQLSAETYLEGTTIDPGGKAITIRGMLDGNGVVTTILDGGGSHRVLRCSSGEGEGTVFQNLVIRNGDAAFGAGLYNNGSSPTLINCMFAANVADFGGGIYNQSSDPRLTNCRFSNNTATIEGGGVAGYISSPILSNCRFTGNSAGDDGGGMFNKNASRPILNDCRFVGNSAGEGGGGMANLGDSRPTLNNCLFDVNESGFEGGGMYNKQSDPILNECTFTANTAGYNGGGGGISNKTDSHPTGTGLLFCGNLPTNINSRNTMLGTTILCQSILPDCSDCPDSDEDGVPDYLDVCPGGDDGVDSDSDGTPDACDQCPNDENKAEPGRCGCGVVESDVTGDLDCDGDYDVDDARIAMAEFGILEHTHGDADGDGDVDADDFIAVRALVDQGDLGCILADIDGDGIVGGSDLGRMLGYWGACSTP